ncbi:MAG: YhcH/YjgK/YiaL family protein [Prevotellaceae bacterium]|jgi:YhcH/YjgK/YiaL family protein|nr:YhcH/YjgK/YiaL family protein [Prevotellaceae bacterium]
MIIDSVTGFERYLSQHPAFEKAFKFLRSQNIEALVTGRHEIDGENVFAFVSEENGRSLEEAKLEVHDSYIDIQLLISGSETMGWKDRTRCDAGGGAYDDTKDIAFYDDEPDLFFVMEPLNLVIFYPHDAHAPMIGDGVIKKVVVKVKV